MDVKTLAHLLAIAFGPTAAIGSIVWAPAVVRAMRKRMSSSRPHDPAIPLPIERLAADLRRLLALHDAEMCSPGHAVRAARLAALRGAISDTAVDAARALEVRVPPRTGRDPFPVAVLTELLDSLAEAGLVLPRHRGRLGGSS